MVSVHPSSLIGAQAYAAQLRRQYGQEETARAFDAGDRQAARTERHAKRAASAGAERGQDNGARQPSVTLSALASGNLASGNPTIGDISPRPNPPARPLFSSAKREAPNPNALLRNVRPGTHLDITI